MPPEHLCKIRDICVALAAAGFDTIDKQAEVLGLPRSTTWTMLRGKHKKSGISATLLTRMLKSHRIPQAVRAKACYDLTVIVKLPSAYLSAAVFGQQGQPGTA
jgi:hypothetical protein